MTETVDATPWLTVNDAGRYELVTYAPSVKFLITVYDKATNVIAEEQIIEAFKDAETVKYEITGKKILHSLDGDVIKDTSVYKQDQHMVLVFGVLEGYGVIVRKADLKRRLP